MQKIIKVYIAISFITALVNNSLSQNFSKIPGLKKLTTITKTYDNYKDSVVSELVKQEAYSLNGLLIYRVDKYGLDTAYYEYFKYDQNNRIERKITKEVLFNYFDEMQMISIPKFTTFIEEDFVYNENGLENFYQLKKKCYDDTALVAIYNYSATRKTNYEFDEKGNVLKCTKWMNNDQEPFFVEINKYGTHGKTYSKYYTSGTYYSVDTTTISWKYNNKGQIEVIENFKSGYEIPEYVIEKFYYNNDGNLTKKEVLGKQNNPPQKIVYYNLGDEDSTVYYSGNKRDFSIVVKKGEMDSLPNLFFFEDFEYSSAILERKLKYDEQKRLIYAYVNMDGIHRTGIFEYEGMYPIRVKRYAHFDVAYGALNVPEYVIEYIYEYF